MISIVFLTYYYNKTAIKPILFIAYTSRFSEISDKAVSAYCFFAILQEASSPYPKIFRLFLP